MRRYDNVEVLGFHYATSDKISRLRENIKNGNITCAQIILQEGVRLDNLAGKYYGDGKLYWIIAAASGIGFCLQTPPGTVIMIPKLSDVGKYA